MKPCYQDESVTLSDHKQRVSDIRDEAVYAIVGAVMRLASPRAQWSFHDVIRAGIRAEKERLLLEREPNEGPEKAAKGVRHG